MSHGATWLAFWQMSPQARICLNRAAVAEVSVGPGSVLQPVLAFEDDVEHEPGDDHYGDRGGEASLPAEAGVRLG